MTTRDTNKWGFTADTNGWGRTNKWG